jgi:hypothetical protein
VPASPPARQAHLRHRAHRGHLPQRPRRRRHQPSAKTSPSSASKARLSITEEEESALAQAAPRSHGPGQHDGPRRVQRDRQRHTFLETQRKDLLESIENTQASIKEIDDVSRIKFDEAFKIINENFSVTFTKLFGGGQAFMKLTDAENSNERHRHRRLASGQEAAEHPAALGGEKALTALSLLVGIFQFQPAPFCVLDEVDAPLDETNVGRFAKLISDMSATTQFVVITHSKRTMSQADVIYGVTMQEPGVSKIVSVALRRHHAGARRLDRLLGNGDRGNDPRLASPPNPSRSASITSAASLASNPHTSSQRCSSLPSPQSINTCRS